MKVKISMDTGCCTCIIKLIFVSHICFEISTVFFLSKADTRLKLHAVFPSIHQKCKSTFSIAHYPSPTPYSYAQRLRCFLFRFVLLG